ncbi:amino acid adenylation domain-containing protein, partial [Actinacidiphila acididurans]
MPEQPEPTDDIDLSEILAMDDAERQRIVVGWNDTGRGIAAATLPELFAAQARRTPDATALAGGTVTMDYRELDERSNRLARVFAAAGVGPEVRVAIMLPRSPEMVITMLAVVKAGGAYVPVDPDYPATRISLMLDDAEVSLVVAGRPLNGTAPGRRVVVLDEPATVREIARADPGPLPANAALTPDSALCVFYTSGSTGTPKGAVAVHRAVDRLVRESWFWDAGPGDVVGHLASVSFDAALLEIWGALLTGATVAVAPPGRLSIGDLTAFLTGHDVSLLFMTCGLFHTVADVDPDTFAGLRLLITGGDVVSPAACARVLSHVPGIRMVNAYGPTENSCFTTVYTVTEQDTAGALPIGAPIAETRLYVLDDRLATVPVGVDGELYLAGDGLARGYFGRRGLTAHRFVADPFTPGGRLYRTGDIARWRRDGVVEFAGRADEQVKIRGFRVEPGEVEVVLAGHEAVASTVVQAREDIPGDKRLVAYVVPRGTATAADLREHLTARLPEYLVPSAFVFLGELPLNTNGKVDRRALPAPEHTTGSRAPRDVREELICAAFAEVLAVEAVGVEDSFFDLGGHSLLAVRLVELLRERGVTIDVRTLFASPTPARLAVAAARERVDVPPCLIPPGADAATVLTAAMVPLSGLTTEQLATVVARVDGGVANVADVYPLAPLQEGLLFHHQLGSGDGQDPYVLRQVLRFDSRARLDAFLGGWQQVVDRHDILRTAVFADGLPHPVQVVQRHAELPVHELGEPAGDDPVAWLLARCDEPMDLGHAPLMDAWAAPEPGGDRWLLALRNHHIVLDHTTSEVVLAEVRAVLAGRGDELPPVLPYREFVGQARMGVSDAEHAEYFTRLLGGVTETTAPYGVLDVRGSGEDVATVWADLPPELARRVHAQARRHGVSAATIFHVVWARALAEAAGREDVVFGTVLFGRMQAGAGADRVLGLFINTLPVYVRTGGTGVLDAVRAMRDQLAELMVHEHAPLSLAQSVSGVRHPAPLFTALFNYRHFSASAESTPFAEASGIEPIWARERSNYPLNVSVNDLGDGFSFTVQCVSRIDAGAVAELLATETETVVGALESDPQRRLPTRAVTAPAGSASSGPAEEPAVARRGPRDLREELLCDLFAEVLGREEVGVDDNFFHVGGHSLLATRLVARIRGLLGVEIRLATVFDAPTVAALARHLDAASPARAAVPVAERPAVLPLSFAQRRLWFLAQLEGPSATYNIPLMLRLRGELDVAAMQAALTDVVVRHESLRTRFGVADGTAYQQIVDADRAGVGLPVVVAAAADVRARAAEAAAEPFDLARDLPVRARLIDVGGAAEEWVFILVLHHIAGDGWSMVPLWHDLTRAYAARAAGAAPDWAPLPVQYADYTLWQHDLLGPADEPTSLATRQVEFWRDALAGAPRELALPVDHRRPRVTGYDGAAVSFTIPAPLHDALRTLARDHQSTIFMVLQAAVAVLLSRLGAGTDVPIGTVVAGRTDEALDDLVGLFVNTLVLRTDLSGDPTFADLLDRVRAGGLAAFENQDVPFERLVEELAPERSLARHPLFQVMLTLQNAHHAARDPRLPGLPGVEAEPYGEDITAAKFDLQFSFAEMFTPGGGPAGVDAVIVFAVDLFERATAEALGRRLVRVLERVTADPTTRVTRIDVLEPAERLRLAAWSDGEAAPAGEPGTTLPELFARAVRSAPGAVAVVDGPDEVTYAELDAWSDRVAAKLAGRGVGPESTVAVVLPRSAELIAVLLGVWKAGGAYVPVDPGYPAERIAATIADAAPAVVIDEPGWAPADDGPATVPAPDLRPENPAYVIYTSGTTGRPKGVVVPHGNVVALFAATRERFGLGPRDVWSWFHSFAFDFSVWELWGALLHGGRVVVVPPEVSRSPRDFADLLAARGVTVLSQTPSAFHQLPAGALDDTAVRLVVFGGEALDASALASVPARVRLVNMYGITETTVHATWVDVPGGGWGPRSVIGHGLPGLATLVLDDALLSVPAGVAGELYVGGAQVARGYADRAGLTASRFVADPRGTGGRLYRTGDVVRRDADGRLEFLGRADDQVKVRGFRVEPAEIEAVLTEDGGAERAVVVLHGDDPADRRLVAYLVPADVDVAAVRERVARRLPGHMAPAAYLALAELPLTPNGKVDRRALPAPDYSAAAGTRRAPRSVREHLLCAVFAEVLAVDEAGPDDSFFDLGGHSLLVTRLVSRIRTVLGTEIRVRDVFDAPTPAGLDRRMETADRARPALTAGPRPDPMPLSYAQRRLWFLDQLDGPSATYDIPLVLGLTGALDVPALDAALLDVLRRHESLRTRAESADGNASARVVDAGDVTSVLTVAGPAEPDVVARAAGHRFDLAVDLPVRAWLFPDGDGRWVLVLVVHHIAGDGWSLGPLWRDVATAYEARVAGRVPGWRPLPVQYADYVLWQRDLLGDPADPSSVLAAQTGWWREALRGAPAELPLPYDRPRPRVASHRGDVVAVSIPGDVYAQVVRVARARPVTVFMVLHAALVATLSRSGAGTDVSVGTVVAGRTDEALDDLVGLFVNTLVLRTDLSGDPTFADLLDRVRETGLSAFENQDVPFERLVEELAPERSLARHPLFQVMLTLQNAPASAPRLAGVGVEPYAAPGVTAKFDLEFAFTESPDGLTGLLAYTTDLFDRATAEALAGRFVRVLAAATADPGTPLDGLPVLGAAERRDLLEAGTGETRAVPGLSVPELVTRQAARTPGAPAIVSGSTTMTYRELDDRSDRLARALTGAGARVGVVMRRSPELIVTLLAVLKSGAAYVPVDIAAPPARWRTVLDGIPVVVADPDLAPAVREAAPDATVLTPADELPDGAGPLGRPIPGSGLAYVMYTSGSSGVPQGVAVTHRDVAELVSDRCWSVDDTSAVLMVAPHSFDASVFEIWVPLTRGARVVQAPAGDLSAASLRTLIRTYGLTHVHLTAGLFRVVAEEDPGAFTGVREVLTGGDVVPAPAVARVLAAVPGVTVRALYGPTEITLCCTQIAFTDPAEVGPAVPIGRPLDNTRAYVLDDRLSPVPAGVRGELYVAGAGLARGYLGQPARTAERFVADPYTPGGRLYRTGDVVRWTGGGRLEFVSRADEQVKVRGYRVEPAEIEAVLGADPSVAQSVVVARDDTLIAYVVPATVDPEALRELVAAILPEYSVPSAFVTLDALPLTPNGKVDRRALPLPGRPDGHAGRAPRTPRQQVLAEVFKEILARPSLGADDSFFDLGGHSLLATRLVARVRSVLGAELSVRDVFDAPTVAGLDRLLDRARPARPELTVRARPPRLPLSSAQQRLWFLTRLDGPSAAYNIPLVLRLTGAVDPGALRDALRDVVIRHESLRTRFGSADGRPFQQVLTAGSADVALPVVDVADEDLRRHVTAAAAHEFDLENEAPLRATLFRLPGDRWVLVLVVHHLAGDGASLDPLWRDLSLAYAERRTGRQPSRPPLPVQYADYALWQHDLLGDADDPASLVNTQVGFWRAALAGAPPELTLPADRPRPPRPSHAGGLVELHLTAEEHERLRALAREHQVTVFMVLQAAVAVLLSRLGAGTDIPIGTPVAGRTDTAVQDLVGFFVNTLVLRTDLSGDPAFAEVLRRVRQAGLSAFEHQDVPFERLVEELAPERSLSRHPLFQIMLTVQNTEPVPPELDGVRVESFSAGEITAKFDLEFSFAERLTADGAPAGVDGSLVYATDLFDERTAAGIGERLIGVLDAVGADPSVRVADVPVLSRAELDEFAGWNDTVVPARPVSLVDLFASSVSRWPG